MKVEESKIRKLRISEVENIDIINIFLEDLDPGKGRITIECYGKSWTSFWGGMGDKTISEFFCKCDENYLVENLVGNISSTVVDENESKKWLRKKLIIKRRLKEVNWVDARKMWKEIDNIENPEQWVSECGPLSMLLFNGDFWCVDFPQKQNHNYENLLRIINVVKKALKSKTDSI